MLEGSAADFVALQRAIAGRYSLERELGRGGMGIVYLARDVALDRPVALKLLPPALAAQTALRERFLREARTAAKLSHPHIIPIFSVEEVERFVFFVMAYVQGETLGQRIRERGPLPASEVGRILREVAWALAYAHAQGVVHRDVKADNILLEAGSGRALVADFGIARRTETAGVTAVGEVVGTAEYMSPEQASGEDVDGRSDLYSLAVLGYYALSGRLPFTGTSVPAVLAQHITQPAPPVAAAAPGIPGRLAQAIDRCLSKAPDQRFQKAEDLADALAASLEIRRDLPVPLRVLFKQLRNQGRALGVYPVAGMIFLPGLILPWLAGGAPGAVAVANGVILTLIAAMPVASATVWFRRVLKAGYNHGDVVLAWRTEREREVEERAFEHGREPSRFERVMRWKARGLSILGAGAGVWVLLPGAAGEGPAGLAMALALTGGLGAGLIAFMRYQRRTDLVGRWIGKFLNSRLGRGLFKLAGLGLRDVTSAAPLTHRPTELAIGMAVDQMFAALPPSARQRLGDLPATVRGLEQDATNMRRRVQELNDVLARIERGGPGAARAGDGLDDRRAALDADVRATRDAAERRLADAVAALEGIRLDLLRLSAGAGSVDSLTADLAAAREVSEAVEHLLKGRAEVAALLEAR
jgi:serine/threonine-protein kinase